MNMDNYLNTVSKLMLLMVFQVMNMDIKPYLLIEMKVNFQALEAMIANTNKIDCLLKYVWTFNALKMNI
jgi:hypothetical protein